MKVKVVSWNIAGGHTIASLEQFNYEDRDLDYFSNEIKKFGPDIVCLQETHTGKNESSASELSNLLGLDVLVNSANSNSHIEKDMMLGNTILSNLKPVSTKEVYLPDPIGDLLWPDGSKAETHKKNLQYVEFEKFNLANNQMLPIGLFGFNYDTSGRGKDLAEKINETVSKIVYNPVIWCGDFNWQEPLQIYEYMKNLDLKESLPDESTRPSSTGEKKKPDHIFYSPEFKLIDSKIVKTKTDHYLCYAQLEIV